MHPMSRKLDVLSIGIGGILTSDKTISFVGAAFVAALKNLYVH